MNECFGKQYKLCSQKVIQKIFDDKKSLRCYPYVLHYSVTDLEMKVPFQVTISAPKRYYKKAHDRNRIKRIVREAIRKNKLILEPFLVERGLHLALFVIYTGREELKTETLHKKTQQLFKQLIDEISNLPTK